MPQKVLVRTEHLLQVVGRDPNKFIVSLQLIEGPMLLVKVVKKGVLQLRNHGVALRTGDLSVLELVGGVEATHTIADWDLPYTVEHA